MSSTSRCFVHKLAGLIFFGVGVLLSGSCCAAAPGVTDRIDWAEFLARHDLIWDRIPTEVNNAPMIGNGCLSATIEKESTPEASAPLTWQVNRIDVTDRREPKEGLPAPLYDTCRLDIGRFLLQPVGTVQGLSMRIHLWDAVCTGELKTTKGTISWRSFVPYGKDLIVVDFTTTGDEGGFGWKWVPFLDSSTRALGKLEGAKRMTPEQLAKQPLDSLTANYQMNPDVEITQDENLLVSKHPLLVGGLFAVACRREDPAPAERIYRISIQPVSDHAAEDAVQAVQDTSSVDDLFAAHAAWWHAFYPMSFISLPDTRLEGHYWIQNYKLASLTRPGGPPIDVYGYGLPDQYAGWPNIWWNMNVQENYYGCFTANHLELGESLSGSLEKYADNLSQNVPIPEWRGDSAWIGRASDQQLRTEVKFNPDGTPDWAEMELSDLSWAMSLYYRQCRYAADDERLKTKFLPLLEKCVNFYRHLLVKGPDGKLHTPKATSPEIGSDSDLNYDLGALRWDLATLIGEYTRLGMDPPQMDEWKQLQQDLVDFPVGPNGLKIGANMELLHSHRHYSHLLAFYPLYVLDWDNPEQRDLIQKSVDYWYGLFTDPEKKRENFFGYSQTGAASMFASMGRGDDALAALQGYLDYNATPNAFYREGTIEIPFSVSQSTHELMLQSRKGIIRVFPAMPTTWKDAVFENLRTEGAFLVSGRWREGQADWVRVKSLAGEPCRLRVHFDGPVKTLDGATLTPVGDDLYELPLAKGQEVTLISGNGQPDLVVCPLDGDPFQYNYFGYTEAGVARKLKDSVKLAPEFKPGMTLPAGVPIPVSGTTRPGTMVIVKLGDAGKKAVADQDGKWSMTLDPVKADVKQITLSATGVANDVTINKIVVTAGSSPAPAMAN